MAISLVQHAAALGLVLVDVLARAARTRLLLPLSFSRILVVNTCGDAIASITPSRMGGGPVRYVAFIRSGAQHAAILALFGLEIATDAIVLLGAGIVLSITFASAGRALLVSLAHVLQSGTAWSVLAGAGALLVGSAVLMARFFPRALSGVVTTLRESLGHARTQKPGVVALATMLTGISLVARGAILPVLLADGPNLGAGTVIMGSAVLIYGQLLAPTPAAAGAVELGALAGFAGHLPSSALTVIVVAWRGYTMVLSVIVGAAFLIREGLQRTIAEAVRSSSSVV